MPCIVIDNLAWDSENQPGWGGPEYLNFDVYSPNEKEMTLQRLISFCPVIWFYCTVDVERAGNDLRIKYTLDNNQGELERHELGEGDFVWNTHILHNVVPGKQRGSSTWEGQSGPGWKLVRLDHGRRDKKPSKIWAIQRGDQGSFRRQLLELDGRCAISGEVCHEALEAAHIVPAHRGGQEDIHNGILLRADLHRLYDSDPPNFEICPETGKVLPAESFNYLSLNLSEREIDESIRHRISDALRLRREGIH